MLRSLMIFLVATVCSVAAAQTPPTGGGALGGIESANIFEVRPDADQLPGYAEQTNAERNAVQPRNNAPMWRLVNSGEPGYSSLPASEAPEAGVLIQRFVQYPGSLYTSAGEAWRQTRGNWLVPYGGALLLVVLVAVALFYLGRGSMKLRGAETGRKIERFTPFERAAHWINAIAFVILALSGIVMAFGRYVLLPLTGSNLFGWLTWLLKTTHNFVGPVFVVTLIIVFFTFLKDNFFRSYDKLWFRKAGGLFTGAHVPSHRFNGGEKAVFWIGVFFLGALVTASGLVLDQVFTGFAYLRSTMQVAHMVHMIAAVFMMCVFIGHIYLGTIGMQGAYKAMRTGYVDETWAREHHELWLDDIEAGKIPAKRSGTQTDGGNTVRPAKV